jgi:hypothetical protein
MQKDQNMKNEQITQSRVSCTGHNTKEWRGFKSYLKMYFSPYTDTTTLPAAETVQASHA